MTRFLAGMDAGIAKLGELAAASKDAEDAVAQMALAADDAAVVVVAAMGRATGSVGDLRDAFGLAGGAADVTRGQVETLGLAAEAAGRGFAGANDAISSMTRRLGTLDGRIGTTLGALVALDAELDKKKAAFLGTAGGAAALSAMMASLAVGATASAAASSTAAGGMRLWGTGIRLTAVGVHALISGVVEFLAVAIPATVAAGVWAAVWMQGAQNVQQHMSSLYTATEATANMFHTTVGQALGLRPALQAAQNAANPQVYLALGSALSVVKEHFGGLAQAGLQVGHTFDLFSARLVADFAPGGSLGGAMDAVLSKMVTDLTQFGQVFGNLGHAILEFGAKMPGAANLLLSFLVMVTRLIVALSDLPRPLIYAVFALHEFNTWGSVVVAMLTRLGITTTAVGGSFFGFARAAGIIRAVLSVIPFIIANIGAAIGLLIPALAGLGGTVVAFAAQVQLAIDALTPFQILLIAAAAVGLGFLIDKLLTAKTATQEFAASLQAAADKASNLRVLGVLAGNALKLGDALRHVGQVSAQAGTAGMKYGANLHAVQNAQTALTSALASTGSQFLTVTRHAQDLARTYHTSFVGALVLADAAGIKLNKTLDAKSWATAQIMVQSLVRGYQAMGQPLGAVGKDMTALAIQSGLAGTQVSKLNQAWDEFMSNLTAGTTGLASFNQSLTQLTTGTNKITTILGKSGSVTLSVKDFAQSLTSFTGKGAQAWQNFNQVVGSTAPQLIDWFRTAGAEGALSGQKFQRGILDMLSQLTPLASKSKVAQAELLGLAQQAGLGIRTFPQLEAAIKGTGASGKDLAKIVSGATVKMSDMSAVAKALGTVMNGLVTQSLASAALGATKFQMYITNAAQAMQTHMPVAGHAAQYWLNLATQAEQQASANAQAMASHFGNAGSAAQTMAGHVSNLILVLRGLHDKTVHINIVTSGTVPQINLPGTKTYASGTGSARPGPALVGERGPELMWMRGGEHILPAVPTSHLLNLAAAMAPKYAAGTPSASRMPSLDSALRTAGHVPSALNFAAGGPAGGHVVVHNHIYVPLPNSREQYREVQTQAVRVNRRNPDNRLGIVRGRGG